MYGAPAVDGVTVKATLDGRGSTNTADADAVPRELTPAEIAETTETVTRVLPGPVSPTSSARTPSRTSSPRTATRCSGAERRQSKIYCATGFSGGGFKMATGYGEIAAHEALGKRTFDGLDFVRPRTLQDDLTRPTSL